jgi:hypothetical protein
LDSISALGIAGVILSQEARDFGEVFSPPASGKAQKTLNLATCADAHGNAILNRLWRLRRNTAVLRTGTPTSIFARGMG